MRHFTSTPQHSDSRRNQRKIRMRGIALLEKTLLALCLVASLSRAVLAQDVVLDWNGHAANAIVTVANLPPPRGLIRLAMVHVAIYDAVNAIEGYPFAPYAVRPDVVTPASPDAAAVAAALEQARKDLNHAIRLDNKLAWAYQGLGIISLSNADTAKAKADFSRAIQLDPKLALAYFNRGLSLLLDGKDELAQADFDECLRLRSDLAKEIEQRSNLVKRLRRHPVSLMSLLLR